MDPIKYLWTEKDHIYENLHASTMTYTISDVIYYSTSGEVSYLI